MGVKGLQSYIESYNRDCLKPRRLHNCVLIIDGPNLAYYLLYKSQHINHALGGDYDIFAGEVENFLDLLKKCSIKPIVLIDGALNEKKMETEFKRAEEKISNSLKCSPWNSKQPRHLFMYEVFFNVLKKHKIDCMRSEKEADCDAAKLAKMLNAPVLSADTDFYVYDARFIPLRYLSFDALNNGRVEYLDCIEFDQQAFCSKYGIDRHVLPLFAALAGNDYVNEDYSDTLSSLLPKQQQNHFNAQHDKMHSILCWLRNQDSLETAVSTILKLMSRNDRAELEEVVRVGIEEYLESFTTMKWLPTKKIHKPSQILKFWKLKTKYYDDTAIPKFFTDAFRQGKLPGFCLDLINQGLTIMAPQVECEDSAPAFESALGLLLSLGLILRGDASKEPVVTFHMRHGVILSPTTYVFKYLTPNFGTTLSQIDVLSFREKKRLLARILNLKNLAWIEVLPEDLQLFFLAAVYWSNFSTEQVTSIHKLSLVLCVLIVNIIEHKKEVLCRCAAKLRQKQGTRRSPVGPYEFSCEELTTRISVQECFAAKCALAEYFDLPENDVQYFDRKVVHVFSSLQAVLQVTNCLNVILGEVYKRPAVQHLLSGTIFYNICTDLDGRRNVKGYIHNMLRNAPNILALFRRLVDSLNPGSAAQSVSGSKNELGLQWTNEVDVMVIEGYQNQRIVRAHGLEGLGSRIVLETLLQAAVK